MWTKEVSRREKKKLKNPHISTRWVISRYLSRKKNTFYLFLQYCLWWKYLFWEALVQAGIVNLKNKCDGVFRIFLPWERTAFNNMNIILFINIFIPKYSFYCWRHKRWIIDAAIKKSKIISDNQAFSLLP